MRAFVYWNLHRDLFSVRNTRTGRVEAHAQMVVIHDATFAVSQAGRARVLRERRKNVHAGVRGEVAHVEMHPFDGWPRADLPKMDEEISVRGWTRVTYNPYRFTTFVRASDERPLEGAEEVRMVIRGGRARVYARGLKYAEEVAQAA